MSSIIDNQQESSSKIHGVTCPPTTVSFLAGDKQIGKLFINDAGELDFTGDLTQSAQKFLEFTCSTFNKMPVVNYDKDAVLRDTFKTAIFQEKCIYCVIDCKLFTEHGGYPSVFDSTERTIALKIPNVMAACFTSKTLTGFLTFDGRQGEVLIPVESIVAVGNSPFLNDVVVSFPTAS